MKQPVSLVAIRAFVEVARLGSMKSAALALGVTAGAVSQQIRLIEERLGVSLFHRTNRDVRLTEHGLRLFDAINRPFREIEDAIGSFHLENPRNESLVVTTTPSFAACWLVPKLGRFAELYPAIEVRIDTSVDLVDLRRTGADIAIRHGSGIYSGMDTTLLVTPNLIVIGSPNLLQGRPPILKANDCLQFPLLQDRNRTDWNIWIAANGVADPERRGARGTSFPNDALLIEATREGQGLAVVRDVYAQRSLDQGHVVVAFPGAIKMEQSYFLVTSPEMASTLRVRAFKTWLKEEFASISRDQD